MKKLTILLLFVLTMGVTNAQTTGYFSFRFMDVATGYSIVPDIVEIRPDDRTTEYNIAGHDIANNGTVSIEVKNGLYSITISASGYRTMSSLFRIHGQTQIVNFHLEGLKPMYELSAKYIRSKQVSDSMVIIGFVVDDVTGRPVADVRISPKDNVVSTLTDQRGYFELMLPLPARADLIEKRSVIEFHALGYIVQARENFDIWPKGDLTLQVRLKRGKGYYSEKVLLTRQAYKAIIPNK